MGVAPCIFRFRGSDGEQAADFFQMAAVGVVEGGEFFAVDVEDGFHFSRLGEDGDDYLGARQAAAGDMPRKLLDIWDYEGLALLSDCATYATTIAYVHAG